MQVFYLPCYDGRGHATGEVFAPGGQPCAPLADAVLSDGTLVQHKTAHPGEEQVKAALTRFVARRILQDEVLALISRFEQTHRVTVKELQLGHGRRLLAALDGDYNERTNYVTAEVVPWP